MVITDNWPLRVARGHPRLLTSVGLGVLSYLVLRHSLAPVTRAVLAWDIGAACMLLLCVLMFAKEGADTTMAANAERQQEGEWTTFSLTLAGVVFSFIALTQELGSMKDVSTAARTLRVTLVAATLLLSWMVTHVVFALRYAHEYYTATNGETVDGGLAFPGGEAPDYWDFLYFSIVLGMTFQVSDVTITSRKLRRLAMAHGVIGFLFNTVIVALTVNIAASLLN